MFKRENSESELFEAMSLQLQSNAAGEGFDKLAKAVDYLNVVGELLDDVGYSIEAEEIVVLLEKIAKKAPKKAPKKNPFSKFISKKKEEKDEEEEEDKKSSKKK